jgi:osmotically-inducible protein OsmY
MSHDRQLQEAVLAELGWDPSVVAAHIGVAANFGVITLTGHVESFAQKHAAENATLRVKGVKGDAEKIEVRLANNAMRTDDVIAAAAIDHLSWDVAVPRDSVQVQVENGWITLTGEVDWYYQKDAVEQDVRRLFGVVGVSNNTTIKPRRNASNISQDIFHALCRSWLFDPKTITVSARGGTVHLGGTVHSPHERNVAVVTAWAAGATDVENDIAIK